MSLKLENLSKRLKDKWVVRDASFEVNKGEVFGLFGPSGSGKTSLLNLLLGRSSANGGAVFFDNQDLTKSRRSFTAPKLVNRSIRSRLLRSAPTLTGEQLTRYLNEAIDGAKSVLVLDRALDGMDANLREKSIASIRIAARERDICVIFGSSNFEEILLACDRAAVIINGEIKQIGTPQEIYERPESRVVAAVTGRNNLFAARRLTSSKADIPEFHTIDGGHRLFAERIERGGLGALNQNVTLAIRPEYVSISFGASFPEDNLLKASVERIQFLGPTTLLGLDAGGLKLEALVLRVVGLNVGDECMVGLPPDRIRIFKD